jgi:hypothetical protein
LKIILVCLDFAHGRYPRSSVSQDDRSVTQSKRWYESEKTFTVQDGSQTGRARIIYPTFDWRREFGERCHQLRAPNGAWMKKDSKKMLRDNLPG